MRAGPLRHRVSIISPRTTARSTDGAPLLTFTTTLKDVWADVKTFSAKESYKNDFQWSATDKVFTLRFTTVDISSRDLIVYKNERYQIQSVIDVGERRREHEIVGRKTT